MKKIVLSCALAGLIAMPAVACGSDTYTETVTTTSHVKYSYVEEKYVAPKVVYVKRPCVKKVAKPVYVKTHTEIVDHYQIYQPVYQPVGVYTESRIVEAQPCGSCY